MKHRYRLSLLVLLVLITGSCGKDKYTPREGDLLFVVDSSSAFSKAVTDATAWDDSLKYSHVAMMIVEDGKPYILEATSKKGVACTGWDDFMDTEPNGSGFVIMRLNIGFPVEKAVARAKSHLGKSYDWSFLPDNDKFYCSELIYDCYRDLDGTPLFTAHPMNFRDKSGNMPDFWVDLFEKLGETIPEGVPGTYPSDLAKEPILSIVYTHYK